MSNYCETNGIKLTFIASTCELTQMRRENFVRSLDVSCMILGSITVVEMTAKSNFEQSSKISPMRLSMCVHCDYNCHRFITSLEFWTLDVINSLLATFNWKYIYLFNRFLSRTLLTMPLATNSIKWKAKELKTRCKRANNYLIIFKFFL